MEEKKYIKNQTEVGKLAEELASCRKLLTALGDETRQHIILQMLMYGQDCYGMRVLEITQLTHLSRPAVSHHIQILKEAGVLSVRKEGTRHFYYFESAKEIEKLIGALEHADRIIQTLPDRSNNQ